MRRSVELVILPDMYSIYVRLFGCFVPLRCPDVCCIRETFPKLLSFLRVLFHGRPLAPPDVLLLL